MIFKIDTANQESALYTFTGDYFGGFPTSSVILDSAGNVYGTTTHGGIMASQCGTPPGCRVVYKVDASGRASVLYAFTGVSGGLNPIYSALTPGPAGHLYGITPYNVFEILHVDTAH